MEKTALQWLEEQVIILSPDKWKQALEMEKQQIETAFEEGMFHHTSGLCPDEYYEETYKNL
jgi:hypothetical protein